VATDVLHVTIHFIGALEPAALEATMGALSTVAERHAPAPLTIGVPGSFGGRRRPRVTWLGFATGGPAVARISADVAVALGEDAPDRPSAPHLTVARGAPAQVEAELLERLGQAGEIAWTAERLVLYRSFLAPRGPRYEELGSFPLGGSG
jgi:2'-5' RNA ligase